MTRVTVKYDILDSVEYVRFVVVVFNRSCLNESTPFYFKYPYIILEYGLIESGHAFAFELNFQSCSYDVQMSYKDYAE